MSGERSDPIEVREREFFDRYYAAETCNATGLELRLRRDLRALLKAGTPLGRVLSIGCGDGLFETMLAVHAREVVGIDLSQEAVDRARARAAAAGVGNVAFRCRSVAELVGELAAGQLPESSRFDGVVCLALLHHVPEAELPGLLRQLAGCLRPGGIFYSQDPSRHGALRWLGRRLLGAGYDRHHSADERELSPAELTALLREAGFADTRVSYVDLTLIPAQYLFPRGPAWLMHAFAWLDRLWCASPLARWASGFSVLAARSR